MMQFRTMYDDFERVPSPAGNPEVTEYAPLIGEDGVLSLQPVGTIDVRAQIDSFRESCDLNVILSRYLNGDASALSATQGYYFDAVDMPKTYAEMLNTVITAENEFLKLPLNIRERFDNSFQKWLSLMDNPVEFNRLMGVELENPVTPETGEADV